MRPWSASSSSGPANGWSRTGSIPPRGDHRDVEVRCRSGLHFTQVQCGRADVSLALRNGPSVQALHEGLDVAKSRACCAIAESRHAEAPSRLTVSRIALPVSTHHLDTGGHGAGKVELCGAGGSTRGQHGGCYPLQSELFTRVDFLSRRARGSPPGGGSRSGRSRYRAAPKRPHPPPPFF